MLDVVNEDLIRKGEDAIAFDSDCREGICGACGCMINGIAHGPDSGTTTCQLHMRRFTRRPDHRHRAVAGQGVPRSEGSHRRSDGVRPHHRGRRLHLGRRGRRAGREQPAGSQRQIGRGHGFGGLHRLRRVRGGVQERRGAPVYQRQDHASRAAAAGRARARASAWCAWSDRWKPKALETARTKGNAKRCARS